MGHEQTHLPTDVRVQVRNYPSFNVGGGPFDIDFVIRGPELESLARFSEELRERANAAGGFRGLDTSLRLNKPELRCFQAYPTRGADITTRMSGDRVKLIGRARTVIEGVFRA